MNNFLNILNQAKHFSHPMICAKLKLCLIHDMPWNMVSQMNFVPYFQSIATTFCCFCLSNNGSVCQLQQYNCWSMFKLSLTCFQTTDGDNSFVLGNTSWVWLSSLFYFITFKLSVNLLKMFPDWSCLQFPHKINSLDGCTIKCRHNIQQLQGNQQFSEHGCLQNSWNK